MSIEPTTTHQLVALALLGLGWNLGLISGTAIITDAVPLATRAKPRAWSPSPSPVPSAAWPRASSSPPPASTPWPSLAASSPSRSYLPSPPPATDNGTRWRGRRRCDDLQRAAMVSSVICAASTCGASIWTKVLAAGTSKNSASWKAR